MVARRASLEVSEILGSCVARNGQKCVHLSIDTHNHGWSHASNQAAEDVDGFSFTGAETRQCGQRELRLRQREKHRLSLESPVPPYQARSSFSGFCSASRSR